MSTLKLKEIVAAIPQTTEEEVAVEKVKTVEEAVPQAVNQEFETKISGSNPGSLERTFLKGIQSMFRESNATEALIGSAIAGIFGGSEAGAAAVPIGLKLGEGRIQNQARLEQIEALSTRKGGTPGKFQQAVDIVDSRSGNPAVFNPNTGQYQDATGNPIPFEFLKNIRDTRVGISKESLDFRKDIGVKNLEERIKNREFREEEARDLGATQLKEVINADIAISQTDDMLSAFEDPIIGPVAGRVQSMVQLWTGQSDPKFTALKTKADLLLQSYGRAISGTAMSKEERAILRATLPSVNDSPQNFKVKAQEFRAQLTRIKEANLKNPERLQGRGPGIAGMLEGKNKQAYDWAISNPDDPRSAAILKKLGVK